MHLKLFPLTGGFLGVDIFFALSGFLLSRNLIREYEDNIVLGEKDKYFSLFNFYYRRFFRIFPLAFFVASCTLLVISFLGSQEVTKRSVVDYFFSLLFIINFRLIQQQTDYFASTDFVSYFQHYWSLASEEQFYILLPLTLLWALKLHGLKFRGRHLSWKSRLNYLVATLTVCSLITSLLLQQVNPVMNYFVFTSRIWEFGIGILFAVNQTFILRLLKRYVEVIRVVAYITICSSFVFLTPESPYLIVVTLFLIVSISTVLVTADIDGHSFKFSGIFLTIKRVLKRTGDVSFSLYLWHWPLILASGFYFPRLTNSLAGPAFLLVLIYLLSLLTYNKIELRYIGRKPNRKTKAAFKKVFLNIKHDIKTSSGFRKVVVGLLFLAMALNLGFLQRSSSDRWENVASQIETTGLEPLNSDLIGNVEQKSAAHEETVKNFINEALLKTDVTEAEEATISRLLDDRNNLWKNACGIPMNLDFQACADQNPNAPQKIIFLGDSYVVPFVTLIPQILGKSWTAQNMYFGQCNFASVTPSVNGVQYEKCNQHRTKVLNYLRTNPPDAVFIAENWNTPIAGNSDENKKLSLLSDGLRASLKNLNSSTKIFYFGTPPDANSLASCITRSNAITPQCFAAPSRSGKNRALQSQIISEVGGIYIDPVPMLCANLSCPPIIDGIPVTYDGSHLNLEYLIKIKDSFSPFLFRIK